MNTIEIIEGMFNLTIQFKLIQRENRRIVTMYENAIELNREMIECTTDRGKMAKYRQAETELTQEIQKANSEAQKEYDKLKLQMNRLQRLIVEN